MVEHFVGCIETCDFSFVELAVFRFKMENSDSCEILANRVKYCD